MIVKFKFPQIDNLLKIHFDLNKYESNLFFNCGTFENN